MPRSPSCLPIFALCLGLFQDSLIWPLAEILGHPTGMAQAQDDDGDDDGGDDDDGDDDGGKDDAGDDDGPPPAKGRNKPAAAPSPKRGAAAPPAFAPEIVVSDLGAADLSLLIAEGFTLIERREINTLAITLDRLAPPPRLTLSEARDRVRALGSGQDADFNHYYRTSAGDCSHGNCAAWEMVGWQITDGPSYSGAARQPVSSDIASARCAAPAAIGVIDTGINPDHDILKGARLTLLPRGDGAGSAAVHGTAVVSLLIGREESRVPGLVPGAEVVAVDVFRADQGEERADVVDLVEGLDLLAGRALQVYALSLAGPENAVLARMLDRLTDPEGLDAVVVAAAGNGGPTAGVAWPAGHPRVLAVTAVDRRGRVYGAAQRGDHLALAAPGVGLLAATSLRGAREKTGTSFAVPFVTAAAALIVGSGATGDEARQALTASASDLGAPGRDAVFGHGLLSLDRLCGSQAE